MSPHGIDSPQVEGPGAGTDVVVYPGVLSAQRRACTVHTLPPKRILVPVDFSPLSGQALRYALALAAPLSATVEVVYVHLGQQWGGIVEAQYGIATGMPDVLSLAQQRMRDFLFEHLGEGCDRIVAHLVQGDPEEAILTLAEGRGVELIVMATHGRKGLAGWMLGSVTRQVLRRSSVPVLALTPSTEGHLQPFSGGAGAYQVSAD
ncbi:MAG: universal stress protein [Bradymonadia bacterium]